MPIEYTEIWIDGIVNETDLAFCLEFEAGIDWIPKSVIDADSIEAINKLLDTDNTTTPTSIMVADWYVSEKGML